MSAEPNSGKNHSTNHGLERELQEIREALRNLEFGSVQIFVQNGLVVQIDRTEKRRLRPSS